jgi:hypothetical protein
MSLPQEPPRIDKSTLEAECWNLPEVEEQEQHLQAFLLRPGEIQTIWTHEGSHLYYFRQIYPQAKFIPPSIMRTPNGGYRAIESAVDTRGIEKRCDRPRLLSYIKAVVAGGVLELSQKVKTMSPADIRQLMEVKDYRTRLFGELGDSEDQEDFKTLCCQIREASPGLEFDNDGIWSDASLSVAADLGSPRIRAEIDATTLEVKKLLLESLYPGIHVDI